MAQKRQKKAFEQAKGRKKSFSFKDGDEIMKANMRKQGRKGGKLEDNWSGPYIISSLSSKGVATLTSKTGVELKQKPNVSQLKPFVRPTFRGIIILNMRTLGISIPNTLSCTVHYPSH